MKPTRSPETGSGALVGFLRSEPGTETVETHMSWVFLRADRVFKLKKQVSHPFLDFSTPAAREHACREELRLNARLAPQVYLGLMAAQWVDGAWQLRPESALDAAVPVTEWLVCMRRLPAERMLDRAIVSNAVDIEQVDALIAVLVDFYRTATRLQPDPAEYLGRLRHEQAVNRGVLLHPRIGLPDAERALDALDSLIVRHEPLLRERLRQGCVVDGHGDLRPEHVCLLGRPVIIDCIEFNAALRQVDPFDELAYLAMECYRAGATWAGRRILRSCMKALASPPSTALLALYTAFRAMLRARLSLAHLLDAEPRTPQRWEPQARSYLACARRALARRSAISGATRRANP